MTDLMRKKIMAAAIAATVVIGGSQWAAHANDDGENLSEKVPQGLSRQTLPNGAPTSFADLVETVSPAVVSISVEREIPAAVTGMDPSDLERIPEPFRRFFEGPGNGAPNSPPQRGRSQGSGFVIDADGYIVTNNHVVGDGDKITVTFHDGKTLDAKLVGRDPDTDLAVLKVETKSQLSFVPFASDDNLRVGDWVVAVGNPFGLGGTVTAGIVSARSREIAAGRYNDFIQIDAPINQGNSGGPTFDLQGRVVGVNTLIFSPSGGNVGIGFAIPATIAKDIVSQLKTAGQIERGFLGVNIQPISDDIAASMGLKSTEGALITQINPDSPAEKGGLKTGDVIIRVDGKEADDVRQVTRLVGGLKPDARVSIRVIRDSKEKNIKVTIEKRDEVAELPSNDNDEPTVAQLGLSLAPLTDEDRRRLGMEDGDEGAVITNVTPYSEAAEKGIRPGNVILKAGGEDVSSPGDVSAAIAEAQTGNVKQILLFIQTEATRRFVALGLESEE